MMVYESPTPDRQEISFLALACAHVSTPPRYPECLDNFHKAVSARSDKQGALIVTAKNHFYCVLAGPNGTGDVVCCNPIT